MKFTCPHCQKQLSVRDDLAGKQGKCPACATSISVPTLPAAPMAAPGTNEPSSRKEAGGTSPSVEAGTDSRGLPVSEDVDLVIVYEGTKLWAQVPSSGAKTRLQRTLFKQVREELKRLGYDGKTDVLDESQQPVLGRQLTVCLAVEESAGSQFWRWAFGPANYLLRVGPLSVAFKLKCYLPDGATLSEGTLEAQKTWGWFGGGVNRDILGDLYLRNARKLCRLMHAGIERGIDSPLSPIKHLPRPLSWNAVRALAFSPVWFAPPLTLGCATRALWECVIKKERRGFPLAGLGLVVWALLFLIGIGRSGGRGPQEFLLVMTLITLPIAVFLFRDKAPQAHRKKVRGSEKP